MRLAIVILVACMSTGCAAKPAAPDSEHTIPAQRFFAFQSKTNAQTAPVKIIRDTFLNGQLCQVLVLVDQKKAVILKAGETAQLWITPGQHVIAAHNVNPACRLGRIQRLIQAKPDHTIQVRLYRTFESRLKMRVSGY